jgi:glucose uptake protein
MFLPTTYAAALLLSILSMICWGSWANTQKLSGKWRFELFYFDYSFGVLLFAIIAALTFGALNGQELSAMDMFALTGKRKMAYAVAGGAVFNLANILLVAAISMSGLAVAFPVGIGLALVIGVIWNYALNPQGNPALLFFGAAVVVLAIIVDAVAYKIHERQQNKIKAAAMKDAHSVAAPSTAAVGAHPAQSSARSHSSHHSSSHSRRHGEELPVKPPSAAKGIVVSLISGVLMGSFYPLVEMARAGDDGVRPYDDALLFAGGVFVTTFLFNFFFMLMPIHGNPVSIMSYFRGTKKQHLLGVLGGVIWCAGAVSNFVASSAPTSVQVGPAVSYAMGQGATMVSALWGLLVWKEFAGATAQVRMLLGLMIALFIVGLGLVSIAPLYK